MKKLSLEEFKTTFVENTNSDELEKLTGGILGSCHDMTDAEKAAKAIRDKAARILDIFKDF